MNIIKRLFLGPFKLVKFFYWETTVEIFHYIFTGKDKSYHEIKHKR